MTQRSWLYRTAAVTATIAALAACSSETDNSAEAPATSETPQPTSTVNEPLVTSYDGGLYVLDGETLELKHDVPLDGFLRLNPAGDETHVVVTTADGFRFLDASSGQLGADTIAADTPGHVVPHGEHTVLFADGSGEITAFDPHDLESGTPQTQTFSTPEAHHGVAVILEDGTLVHSIGNPENGTGAVAQRDGAEIARSEDCPGVHGESVAADEVIVFGCENGVLEYANGKFTKIPSPTPYGRLGNTRGHDDSPVVLGDMKIDPDAELERPEQIALIDTTTDQMKIVQLPTGVSYWFRSLGRGPQGEALIHATDGKLYVFDPVTGETIKTIDVTGPWAEPDDWQDGAPAVFTREDAVYVSDPATKQIHLVDVEAGTVTTSAELPQAPNELSGAVGHHH